MNPFHVMDCALLVRASGLPPAVNLRELRDRLAACSEAVLYHHFCETPLRPFLGNPDYRNDFAVWAKLHLNDRVLAERLGLLDPYEFASIAELRAAVLELVDERLAESVMVPWARPGEEFHFQEATTVVFDTGERIAEARALPEAVLRMSDGSLYFHFLEARRRPPRGLDDFSAWLLEEEAANAPYLRAIAGIDFYFHSLAHLRQELADRLAAARGAR